MESNFGLGNCRMKIVFVITDYGGFNNFLGGLAVKLVRESISVDVICSPDKVINVNDRFNYQEEGIKFSFIDFPRGFNIFRHCIISSKIKKILDRISPSFVFIHFTTGIFTTTFTGRLKYYTAGMFHGLGYPAVDGMFKRWMYELIEKRCIERLDDIWVLNNSDRDLLKLEFPDKEISLLPTLGLGCDLLRFDTNRFSDEFRSQFRKELGVNKQDIVIAFTGRFVFFKGFDKVVKSILLLVEKKQYSNIKLLLIGGKDPAHSTGLTEDELEKMAACENIIDLGFRSDVEKYLSVTDLFVFPSEKEGMPVCIIEALAMGIPVITADSRGCNDLIKDHINGIVLKENSAEAIALEIETLIQNRALFDSIKTNIVRIRQLLDRSHFIDQQVNYIKEKLILAME